MTFEQILKDLCDWYCLNENDPTPSAVHYANRLFTDQRQYADRPSTDDAMQTVVDRVT